MKMKAEDLIKLYRGRVPLSEIPEIQILDNQITEYAKWLEQMSIQAERDLKDGLLTQEDFDKMIAHYKEGYTTVVDYVVSRMTEIANARTPGQKLKLKVKTLIGDVKREIKTRKLLKGVKKIVKNPASILEEETSGQ